LEEVQFVPKMYLEVHYLYIESKAISETSHIPMHFHTRRMSKQIFSFLGTILVPQKKRWGRCGGVEFFQ